MPLQYFKRFRMEFDLQQPFPPARLPDGFAWVPWNPADIDRHAWVKFQSFRDEVDSEVFPCLGDYNGCYHLMREIADQTAFAPAATWLIIHASDGQPAVDCGTIQGIAASSVFGGIQNVGVIPEFRRLGLGAALVLQALHGFRSQGLKRVSRK
ncbi:MAG: GNAT family N-acetyltransferase [Planctomycetaceae bacterium]